MHSSDDHDLLRHYAESASQQAFATLVARHLDLVFSAARRQLASPQLAEEVAQSVFLDLARHAATLKPTTVLPAWLHTVTRRTAIDVIRRESSRQARERAAAFALDETQAPPPAWTAVEPILDEALAALPEDDRAALLLRFFENKPLRDVGQTLGISDDAAQKRVARALDRLRTALMRRGLTTTAAVLGAQLSAHAIQTTPAALGTMVTIAVAGLPLPTATAATLTLAKILAMTTTPKILVGALVLTLGGALYESHLVREQRQLIAEQKDDLLRLARERENADRARDSAHRELAEYKARLARMDDAFSDLDRLNEDTTSLLDDELRAMLVRNRELKAWAARMPARLIPEMHLLTSTDWLQVARTADTETETGARQALSQLRQLAKSHFAKQFPPAIKRHLETNNNIMGSDIMALAPHFDPPVPPAILARYTIIHPGSAEDEMTNMNLIREAHQADDQFETRFTIGRLGHGYEAIDRATLEIEQATQSYRKAHGSRPTDLRLLIPFLPSPPTPEVMNKINAKTASSGG